MRLFFQFLVFVLGGTSLGYCTADYAMTNGLRTVAVNNGPWKTWPAVALPTADPYTRAHFAQTGKLAVTSFEASTFRAVTDDNGLALDGSCDYSVTMDEALPARWWSITLYGENHKPTANPAGRQSFNSTNVTRNTNGSFAVNISHRVGDTNWLPAIDGDNFFLLLRLFNPDQRVSDDPANAPLPRITRGECR